MNLRNSLITLGLALTLLFSPGPAPAEPPVVSSSMFRVFEYQEDEAPALLRFYLIGKRLFLEQSGMAYWAAEVYLDNPADLHDAPVGTTVAATVRRFSGFSNAGQFWDDGRKATIKISSDGSLTLDIDGEKTIQAVRDRSGRTIHGVPNQSVPEPSPLMGSWSSADGTIAAEFRKDGTMVFMTVTGDFPAEVYFGSYKTTEPHSISYTAERMGWGGMPHEGMLSFSREGDSLNLRSVEDEPSILGTSKQSIVLKQSSNLPIM